MANATRSLSACNADACSSVHRNLQGVRARSSKVFEQRLDAQAGGGAFDHSIELGFTATESNHALRSGAGPNEMLTVEDAQACGALPVFRHPAWSESV